MCHTAASRSVLCATASLPQFRGLPAVLGAWLSEEESDLRLPEEESDLRLPEDLVVLFPFSAQRESCS